MLASVCESVFSTNLSSAAVRWITLQVSGVWCRAPVCMLLHEPLVPPITEKGELIFLNIMDLPISPCWVIHFCFMYFENLFSGAKSLRLLPLPDEVISLSLSSLFMPGNILCFQIYNGSCLLSYSGCLWLVLTWYIFLLPLNFNLIVSLYLKYMFYSQQIGELYFLFLIQSNIYTFQLRHFHLLYFIWFLLQLHWCLSFCNLLHLIFVPSSFLFFFAFF